MISKQDASLLCDLIQAATDCRWPAVREALLEAGYTPVECVQATTELAKMAGRSPILEEGDFDD